MNDQKNCPACVIRVVNPGMPFEWRDPSCTGRAGCVRADHIPDAGKMVEPHPNRENPAPESDPAGANVPVGKTDIVDRLLALVRLDKPEYGGPYGGAAARECMRAMTDAAAEIARLRAENARLMAIIGPKVHCKSCGTVVPTTGPEAWDCDCMDADEVPRTPKFMAHDEAACNHVARLRADRAALATRVAEAVREACAEKGHSLWYDAESESAPSYTSDGIRALDLGPIVAAALKESAP